MPLVTQVKDVEVVVSDCNRTPCEVWTRVMGYYRPVSEFNRGKRGEVAERVYFSESVTSKRIEEVKD